jgi:hypothetical protein
MVALLVNKIIFKSPQPPFSKVGTTRNRGGRGDYYFLKGTIFQGGYNFKGKEEERND